MLGLLHVVLVQQIVDTVSVLQVKVVLLRVHVVVVRLVVLRVEVWKSVTDALQILVVLWRSTSASLRG